MPFIKVTAKSCNAQGNSLSQSVPQQLFLNLDMVAAIMGSEIMLKGGNVASLGTQFFTSFRLAQGQIVPTL